MPKLFPPSLSSEVARPLLIAAERVARLAPWEFISDLELLGFRDDTTGALYVGSILGTLGTMFAVVIYRNGPGLRLIRKIATDRTAPEPAVSLEGMDCLKVEWCRKKELQKSDLQTLEAAAFKPQGKGSVWPRFESCQPGWYPWGMDNREARLMTELLLKVARFVLLRESSGPLHHEPLESERPIIPAGEEAALRPEDILWLPFVPPLAPRLEPMALDANREQSLAALPVRQDFIAEMIAPLSPELSFVDERAGRPCLARVVFMVDRRSHFIMCCRMEHGAAQLGEAVGRAFVEALHNAKARPACVQVDDERLATVLRPVCDHLGVPVRLGSLSVAHEAWSEFQSYVSQQTPC